MKRPVIGPFIAGRHRWEHEVEGLPPGGDPAPTGDDGWGGSLGRLVGRARRRRQRLRRGSHRCGRDHLATALAAAGITIAAARRRYDGESAGTRMFLRDVIRVAAALLCLAVAGTAIAFIVRSFFLAWFICAFFFLYASAIAVSGKCVLVGSLIDSSWLALRTNVSSGVRARALLRLHRHRGVASLDDGLSRLATT